jgi:hypothetical protein
VATKALGSLAVLLLALAAACGGGENAAPAPDPTAGLEEETPAPAAAPESTAVAQAPGPVPTAGQASIPEPGEPLVREVYSYSGGPRDPFESVLGRATIGPEFADLILVAIYFNVRSPAASIVVLRDRVTSKRYTVRQGERLGRMRVADVRPKDVTFAIDDYGTVRQESLTLRKQEETQ